LADTGWSWKLIVLPVVAVLTLAIVLLFGAGVIDVTTLAPGARVLHVVLVGLVVLLVLLAVELRMLMRTFERTASTVAHEEPAEPLGTQEVPATPLAAAPPEPAVAGEEIELVHTADEFEGQRVIELARPPKSAHEGAIYATTYVRTNAGFVLRLEEIVALHRAA